VAIPAATSTSAPSLAPGASAPVAESAASPFPTVVVITGGNTSSSGSTSGFVASGPTSTGSGPAPVPQKSVGPNGLPRGTLSALASHRGGHHGSHGSHGAHHGGHSGPGGIVFVPGGGGGVNLGPVVIAAPAHAAAVAGSAVAGAAPAQAAGSSSLSSSGSTTSRSLVATQVVATGRGGLAGALQTTITVLAILHVQHRGGAPGSSNSFQSSSRRHRR